MACLCSEKNPKKAAKKVITEFSQYKKSVYKNQSCVYMLSMGNLKKKYFKEQFTTAIKMRYIVTSLNMCEIYMLKTIKH